MKTWWFSSHGIQSDPKITTKKTNKSHFKPLLGWCKKPPQKGAGFSNFPCGWNGWKCGVLNPAWDTIHRVIKWKAPPLTLYSHYIYSLVHDGIFKNASIKVSCKWIVYKLITLSPNTNHKNFLSHELSIILSGTIIVNNPLVKSRIVDASSLKPLLLLIVLSMSIISCPEEFNPPGWS